jgi:hypothetical protein
MRGSKRVVSSLDCGLRNLGGSGFKAQCRGTTSRYYETKNHDRECKCITVNTSVINDVDVVDSAAWRAGFTAG